MTATWPPDADGDVLPAPPDLVPPPGRLRRGISKVPPWVPAVAVGGLALTSCVYVALVDPNQPNASSFYPQCTFKQLTGLDCPGCGLTRAMHALMTGDPLRAINHNIFILAIFPLAAYTYTRWLLRSTVGYELPALRLSKKFNIAIVPIVLSFWLLRNLPWAPFQWLNSTA